MSAYEKAFAIIVASLYLADSVAWLFVPHQIFSILQYVLWMVVVIYCIAIMFGTWKSIDDRSVRTMCFTLIVISFSMVPVILLAMIFRQFRELSIPIVSLAYTIAILVFLFIAIARSEKKEEETMETGETGETEETSKPGTSEWTAEFLKSQTVPTLRQFLRDRSLSTRVFLFFGGGFDA